MVSAGVLDSEVALLCSLKVFRVLSTVSQTQAAFWGLSSRLTCLGLI